MNTSENEHKSLHTTIPVHVIQEMIEHAQEGLSPVVGFSEDPRVMLANAYQIRGVSLEYINRTLNAFLANLNTGQVEKSQ